MSTGYFPEGAENDPRAPYNSEGGLPHKWTRFVHPGSVVLTPEEKKARKERIEKALANLKKAS